MAGFSKNPFDLLSEDFEDVPKEKETPQKKKKPVVIVGGASGGERKKPIFPGETPKKKKSKAPAAKSTTQPSKSASQQATAKSAPIIPKVSTEPSYEQLHTKAAPFVSAVERSQPSHSVLFKVTVPEKSSLLSGLRDKSFRALEDLIRLDSFNSTFSSALQSRFKTTYAVNDFRSKPIRLQVEKKLMRSELVDRLIGLVKGEGVSEGEACRLVLDLFSTLFGNDEAHNSFLERLQEDIGSKVGSQGNVRAAQGPTLSDFIVEKPIKRKGKGKGAKAPEEPKEEVAQKVESTPSEVEGAVDPLYTPDTLARCFPRGWQAAVLQPTFLLQKKDVPETEPRQFYYHGKAGEGAIVMWSDQAREIVFFIYNLN